MKTFIFLCILTASVANQDECPENEHFEQCGTACPSTCHNYDDFPRPCVAKCVPGCFCNEGLVRNENNICVTPQNCPSRCPENEHFEQCGSSCPSTCDNFDDSERMCNMMCNRRCFCNEGLVRNERNLCVPPEDCPSACQQPKQPGPCTATIHRFFFNNQTRQCEEFIYGGCYGNRNRFMTRAECENACVECPENQHFELCGIPCLCTCETHFPPKPCLKTCVSGCYCNEGYRKTANGNCVKPGRCPPGVVNCPEKQHFKACGTPCLYTCEKFQNRRKRCLERCIPGCFCDVGFLKTEDDHCVRRENCPVRKLIDCPENEHFEECGSVYPTTCDNSEDFERPEVEMCVKGCFCNKGFLRHENGQCVTPENCPRVCQQQKQSGPCTLKIQRFYFNNETRQCEMFIYGGCLGNKNNFRTQEQCEATCIGFSGSD